MPEVLKALMEMKRADLVLIAGKLNLHVAKNWSSKVLAKKIREAQKLQELERPVETPPVVTVDEPANSEFEQLCEAPQEESSGRGGVREGAGRPEGSTAELVRARDIPKQPKPSIQRMLEGLFGLWSMKTGIDEVCLSKEEAFDLALPITQLHDLYCPGLISDTVDIHLMTVWTACNIVAAKVKLIKAANEVKKSEPIKLEQQNQL